MITVNQVKPTGYAHAACFDHIADALQGAAAKFPEKDATIYIASHLLEYFSLTENIKGGSGAAVPRVPQGAIIWNFEQVGPQNTWMTNVYKESCRNHEVWDYSTANVAAWKEHFNIDAKLLPLAYDPAMVGCVSECKAKLGPPVFYGSQNPRRLEVLSAVPGLRAYWATKTGLYGENLDRMLCGAPCILNLHYYMMTSIFEIARCSYLFANGVPVMSETSTDQDDYSHIPDLFHPLETIVARANKRDYPDWSEQRRAYMNAPHLSDHLETLL